MKGKLIKTEKNWVIEDENQIQLTLHPDDVDKIHEWDRMFDNLQARIATDPNVEFEIIKNYTLNGEIKYAKILW